MSSDVHESGSSNRLFHYFSIIGLKPDAGLQPLEGNISQSQVIGKSFNGSFLLLFLFIISKIYYNV